MTRCRLGLIKAFQVFSAALTKQISWFVLTKLSNRVHHVLFYTYHFQALLSMTLPDFELILHAHCS